MSDKEDQIETAVGVVIIELFFIEVNEERRSGKLCNFKPPQSEGVYFTQNVFIVF